MGKEAALMGILPLRAMDPAIKRPTMRVEKPAPKHRNQGSQVIKRLGYIHSPMYEPLLMLVEIKR